MTTLQQSELLNLIERYNSTDPKIIQKNVRYYLKQMNETALKLSEELDISKTTIEGWYNLNKNMRISFENALKVAELTGVTIIELLDENNI